jgi:hypothetical protein
MSLVLNVEILGEFKKLTSATTGAEKNLKGLQKSVGKISSGINKTLGALGVGFGLYAFVDFTKNAIKGAEAAQVADRRLVQVTESMSLFGTRTDVVTDRLIKFADKQELLTGVTAETTKQVQASLMTFGGLAKTADDVGGSFDRATVAALDLAAAGFGSAETNAIQLGKALNDPIKGITALARAGVTFTEAEKERIKTLVESNRLGEAQELILSAIETQVGGTAEATVTSGARMEAAFGQITDAIGLALLPVLEDFSAWLATPEGQEKLQEIVDGVTDIINELTKVIVWISKNEGIVIGLGVAIGTVTTALKILEITSRINGPKIAANMSKAFGWTAGVLTALGAISSLLAILSLPGSSALPGTTPGTQPKPAPIAPMPMFPGQVPQTGLPGASTQGTTKPTVVNNITINSASTNASGIVSSLQGYQNQNGATLQKLLK